MKENGGNEKSAQNGAPRAIQWDEIYRRLEAVQQSIRHGIEPSAEEKRAILKARAKLLAQQPSVASGYASVSETAELEIVEFRMAHETYAFESRSIREVYPLRDYCPLPCTPAFVFGLVNVRGQLISVLDLKKFFGLASQEIDNHNQAIILRSDVMEIGILADALLEVRRVARASLQPALPTLTGVRQEFLLGITPDHVIILDAEKLLSSREIVVYEEVEN